MQSPIYPILPAAVYLRSFHFIQFNDLLCATYASTRLCWQSIAENNRDMPADRASRITHHHRQAHEEKKLPRFVRKHEMSNS